MKLFEESLFLVAFTGEGSGACLVEGWDNVVRYINECLRYPDGWPGNGYPTPADGDSWSHLDFTPGDDLDTRYQYSEGIGEICGLTITRITESQESLAPVDRTYQHVLAENERLKNLISCPHNDDWFEGTRIEAAHQIVRWGTKHDGGKTPADWFWLIGYLAGKCLVAAIAGNIEKAKHHTISTAAALLNWYRAIVGQDTTMRPGISGPELGAIHANGGHPEHVPAVYEDGRA